MSVVGPIYSGLISRGSCMLELQPARLGQRPLNMQGQSDCDMPASVRSL